MLQIRLIPRIIHSLYIRADEKFIPLDLKHLVAQDCTANDEACWKIIVQQHLKSQISHPSLKLS